MASAGWYNDPGQPGRYRYWDGSNWTTSVWDQPSAPGPAPNNPVGAPNDPFGAPNDPYGPPPSSKTAWWVTGAVIALVLLVAAGFGVRHLLLPNNPPVGPHDQPSQQPSIPTQVCPPQSDELPPPPDRSDPTRVKAGNLSFPKLEHPWSGVRTEGRVPFARAAVSQSVTIHENYSPGQHWVASVVLAELFTGDGFYAPQQGAEIVVKCVVGTFYGENTDVTRKDLKSEKITVDGHDAWIIESDLSFDIPNLPTKNELLIVVVVDTKDGKGGLFYASIPGDAMNLEPDVRRSLKELRVTR